MDDYLRKAIISLIVAAAVISITTTLTNAQDELQKINPLFFAISALLFILSMVVWIFSWAYLIKKNSKVSYKNLLKIGYSSIYGALTPVQLGAEALRSIQLKHYFKVPYQESVSASMVVKGLKFLVLLLASFFVMAFLFSQVPMDAPVLIAFVSGFAVVALASFIFLLPLKKSFGLTIAAFFNSVSKIIRQFSVLESFFKNYSSYLERTTISALAVTFLLAVLSFVLEFLALNFAFQAANVVISLKALAVLMILISILERTPILPRGVGIVELVAFNFLSLPAFAAGLSTGQIGAAIIAFDLVRLVIPTITSLIALFVFSRSFDSGIHKRKSLM
ncbi:MAG: lysylphosphatidylglycerol synthase transmembrane domain-containing protein [Candidatus Diapherotrites archaeon]|nr:lysylphosphatidylglycerol synthase transmembrane domain-containing protein [Candidatus Diapherotrites archaeon]